MSRRRILNARARVTRALISTPRSRRLTFVGAASPGALTATLAPQVSHDPSWLGLGLFLLFAVLVARHVSEPRFLAWEAEISPDTRATEDPSHDG